MNLSTIASFKTWTATAAAMALFSIPVAEAQDAREVLEASRTAILETPTLSYEAESRGIGAVAFRLPVVTGTVLMSRLQDDPIGAMLYARGSFYRPSGRMEGQHGTFEFGYDGEVARGYDMTGGTMMEGDSEIGLRLLGNGMQIRLTEFFSNSPFTQELAARTLEVEGRTEVDGVLCDVVYARLLNDNEVRWMIGVEDRLPRQVERMITLGDRVGVQVLTLKNLTTSPQIARGAFTLQPRDGVPVRQLEARAAAPARQLLAPGTMAPDWELPGPDGAMRKLSDYRGQVVLMDFWATWCGPCIRAMPSLQGLHEKYADRGLAVIGVNCFERANGPDPIEFKKSRGLSYGLVLKGDDVARQYNVSGIPAFYIIGVDGRIIYSSTGYLDGKEREFEQVILEHFEANGM